MLRLATAICIPLSAYYYDFWFCNECYETFSNFFFYSIFDFDKIIFLILSMTLSVNFESIIFYRLYQV